MASDLSSFDFMSVGTNGDILKRIIFMPVRSEMCMLVFGNDSADGEIDDLTISDNGDRNKILATIVNMVNLYTIRYPSRLIYFVGSTPARTRLYRMVIGLH
jgi:hypothetical protein